MQAQRKHFHGWIRIAAAALTLAALAAPIASKAGHYEISIGKREPMCRDLRRLLNSDVMPPTPTPLCMWRFEPRLPDSRFPKFALPVWETVDPSAYWDLFKSSHFANHGPDRMPGLPEGEAQRRWTQGTEPRTRALIERRALVLRRAQLNIDATVATETRTVYAVWVNECDTNSPTSGTPSLIVPRLDAPNEADSKFATHQLSGVTPFFYVGQLWFANWDMPDGATEVGGLGARGEAAKVTIMKPYRMNADSKHFGLVGRDCEFHYYSGD